MKAKDNANFPAATAEEAAAVSPDKTTTNLCSARKGETKGATRPDSQKVKRENAPVIIYLSLVLISVCVLLPLFILLLYSHVNRVTEFRQNLKSDFAVEEIRRIAQSVILEEIPWLFGDRDPSSRASSSYR